MSKQNGTKVNRLTAEQRENIANNIYALRKAKFPQKDGKRLCALDMNVDPNQYAPWETGSRTPIHKNLLMIAEYFGVTFEQLCRPLSSHGNEEVAESTAPESGSDTAQTALPKKAQRRRRKSRTAEEAAASLNNGKAEPNDVKTIDLPIPVGALNTKTVRLKYKGDMAIVGIEYLFMG